MQRVLLAALMVPTASLPTEASSQAVAPPISVNFADPSLVWGACPPIFPGACKIAVLQGDPAKPNADVILRVDAGYVLPRHKHNSAERMILLEGKMRVKYDGFDAATLTPSTYAYGPAGLPHEAVCLSRSQCSLFIAFEGPVDAQLVPLTKP